MKSLGRFDAGLRRVLVDVVVTHDRRCHDDTAGRRHRRHVRLLMTLVLRHSAVVTLENKNKVFIPGNCFSLEMLKL